MFKRVVWMGTGYGLGMGTSWWVKRKVQREVKQKVDRYVPPEVRTRVESGAKNVTAAVKPRVEQGAQVVGPKLVAGRERVREIQARRAAAAAEYEARQSGGQPKPDAIDLTANPTTEDAAPETSGRSPRRWLRLVQPPSSA